MRKPFGGNIYTTYATVDLCEIMGFVTVLISRCLRRNGETQSDGAPGKEPVQPLYDIDMMHRGAISLIWWDAHISESWNLADGIQVRFVDASHLLGSTEASDNVAERR